MNATWNVISLYPNLQCTIKIWLDFMKNIFCIQVSRLLVHAYPSIRGKLSRTQLATCRWVGLAPYCFRHVAVVGISVEVGSGAGLGEGSGHMITWGWQDAVCCGHVAGGCCWFCCVLLDCTYGGLSSLLLLATTPSAMERERMMTTTAPPNPYIILLLMAWLGDGTDRFETMSDCGVYVVISGAFLPQKLYSVKRSC